jgi:hypothetical protein
MKFVSAEGTLKSWIDEPTEQAKEAALGETLDTLKALATLTNWPPRLYMRLGTNHPIARSFDDLESAMNSATDAMVDVLNCSAMPSLDGVETAYGRVNKAVAGFLFVAEKSAGIQLPSQLDDKAVDLILANEE